MIARFDPDALHEDLHLYTPGGDYIVAAPCVQPVGFADVAAARRHGKARKTWIRLTREAMKIERSMDIATVAAMNDEIEAEAPTERPESKLIRPIFGQAARKLELDNDEPSESERLILKFGAMARAARQAGESGDD